MSNRNCYIYFPVTKTGYWHNGIHRYGDNKCVKSFLLGEVLIKSKKTPAIVYPSKYPVKVYTQELQFRAPDEYEKYENLSSVNLSELSKDERERVLEAIGLSTYPTYVLQMHRIFFAETSFIYFSFIRHLSTLNDFNKFNNSEYIFPHDNIGNYGSSEGEINMIHQEYFICSDSSYFKNQSPDIFDYYKISKDLNLYKKENQQFTSLYFQEKTEFEVLNKENDYKRYPHSLKLKIKRYHVEIDNEYLEKNKLKIEINGRVLSVLDADDNKIDELKIKILNPFSNILENITVKIHNLIIDNTNYENKFFIREDFFNLSPFWTNADNEKLKHWDNYIFVNKNTEINKYTDAPDKKKFSRIENNLSHDAEFYLCQKTGLTVIESLEGKEYIKLKVNGNDQYISLEELNDKYNLWKDFKDKTKIFDKESLKSYNPDDDEIKNSIDLQRILKEKGVINEIDEKNELSVFLEENKDKLKMCGFQHISEWSQVEITPFKIDYPEETSDLWEKLYIWKKSGKSASLPKEISDSNKFVFFHPDYFENWIFNLHRCFAGRLYAVQDLIMEDWRLKQGNCGVYYNFHDIDTTFCNQAVFETIKNVDGNFINFTGRKDKEFPECPNPNKYEYRPSNYWCDVLKMQSENSSKTGIYKISAEQAFYMAKLGYVVIACWKNSIPKGTNNNINYSPHFVTVRPNNEEYKGIEFIKVAHVGGGRNEEKNILTAFDLSVDENKSSNIFFYCNINQCFI